jgi:rhodanese-related sulfurtransferase
VGIIVDGYFQDREVYAKYPIHHLKQALENLRSQWKKNIKAEKKNGSILHLRLSDFFNQANEAREHVRKKLIGISGSIAVITDQEELVKEEIKALDHNKNIELICSHEMKAAEVLNILSSYEKVITNGSTLAFWASILAKSEFETENDVHSSLRNYLNSI